MTKKRIYADNGVLDTLLPPTRITPSLSVRLAEARRDLTKQAGILVSRSDVIRYAIDYYQDNCDRELLARYGKSNYGTHKNVTTSVWVLKRQADLLNETAIMLGFTRSEVMRRILQLYLDDKKGGDTNSDIT